MKVNALIAMLERMKSNRAFKSYMEYIQFSYFCNSDKDAKGNDLNVLKQRIFKMNNPDQWDAARPNLSYGMTRIADRKRSQPLKKMWCTLISSLS